MKTSISLFLIMCFLFISPKSFGQKYEFGVGTLYGNVSSNIAVNVKGFYVLKNKIYIGADAVFFLKKKQQDEFAESTIMRKELYVQAKYKFLIADVIKIYPLIGVGTIIINEEIKSILTSDPDFTSTEQDIALGLIAGGGASYSIKNQLDAFVQVQFALEQNAQNLFGVGLVYSFGDIE